MFLLPLPHTSTRTPGCTRNTRPRRKSTTTAIVTLPFAGHCTHQCTEVGYMKRGLAVLQVQVLPSSRPTALAVGWRLQWRGVRSGPTESPTTSGWWC